MFAWIDPPGYSFIAANARVYRNPLSRPRAPYVKNILKPLCRVGLWNPSAGRDDDDVPIPTRTRVAAVTIITYRVQGDSKIFTLRSDRRVSYIISSVRVPIFEIEKNRTDKSLSILEKITIDLQMLRVFSTGCFGDHSLKISLSDLYTLFAKNHVKIFLHRNFIVKLEKH